MQINTHQTIDPLLCGRPLDVGEGKSTVSLTALSSMSADDSGLVHGGFVFGLADYAAMIAVNHPNVVLGAADVKFLNPVLVGDTIVAHARVEEIQGKKPYVAVSVSRGDDTVFQGMFTCFALEKHIVRP